MEIAQNWYIVKNSEGFCQILTREQIESQKEGAIAQQWGPYESQNDAIARRVGLIRAGKCQPH